MIKTNNYSFLKYLSYYDLIQKYKFKSIYFVPQINKINLQIAIEQSSVLKLKSQYKAFLFYYLQNFCSSKIFLKFYASLKKRIKTMTLKSKVILNISYKKSFDFLISLIFLFHNKALKSNCTETLITSNIVSGKPQYQHLYLVFSSPLSAFFKKTNQTNQQINFNDLTVFFDFSLKKSVTILPFNFFRFVEKKIVLDTSLYKNIFIFWALKF
jgi:hypothetical protein